MAWAVLPRSSSARLLPASRWDKGAQRTSVQGDCAVRSDQGEGNGYQGGRRLGCRAVIAQLETDLAAGNSSCFTLG